MTPDEILEHYRDVQDGILPAIVRGESVHDVDGSRLFQGWAFRNYLQEAFAVSVQERDSVRVLDYGCGKASYLYKNGFLGTKETLYELHPGKIQQFYCYDPGFRKYMEPPPSDAKFDVIICAGVLGVIPEQELDAALLSMKNWCTEDGIVLFKVPRTEKKDRKFYGSDQSVYINVKPDEYWIDKLDNVLQRSYYLTIADSPQQQSVYERKYGKEES